MHATHGFDQGEVSLFHANPLTVGIVSLLGECIVSIMNIKHGIEEPICGYHLCNTIQIFVYPSDYDKWCRGTHLLCKLLGPCVCHSLYLTFNPMLDQYKGECMVSTIDINTRIN